MSNYCSKDTKKPCSDAREKVTKYERVPNPHTASWFLLSTSFQITPFSIQLHPEIVVQIRTLTNLPSWFSKCLQWITYFQSVTVLTQNPPFSAFKGQKVLLRTSSFICATITSNFLTKKKNPKLCRLSKDYSSLSG